MNQRAFLKLVVLFLGFSSVLSSSAAVPTSRSLKSLKDEPLVPDLIAQGEVDMRIDGEVSEVYIEGRMDMESSTDYPGTGANNHHDPKTPGTF